MPTPFKELARPAEFSCFAPRTGRIHLEGWPVEQLWRFLKFGTLEDVPTAVHEIVHSYWEGSALGVAIYLSQFRYGGDKKQVNDPSEDIRRRCIFLEDLLIPLQEGFSLFAQYDYRPDLIAGGTDCFLDALFYFLAASSRRLKKRRAGNPLLEYALRETAGTSAVENKLDLLLSDLQCPSAHIRGYIWIKQLFSRVARFGAKPFFVQFLADYLFNDFAFAASVLNTEVSDDQFEQRFAAELREKLLWLESEKFLPEVLKLMHQPDLRDSALQRKPEDRAQFHQAVRRFYSTQIPSVGLPSRLDNDWTQVQKIIDLGAARRRVHRLLNSSAFVKESEHRVGHLDFYAVQPIWGAAHTEGPLILTLPRHSANVHVTEGGLATLFVAVLFQRERPSIEAYLIATDQRQLLCQIPLSGQQDTNARDDQIASYLEKSEKIDEFLTYLHWPKPASNLESANAHFGAVYDALWSRHFADGVLKRFFPSGPPHRSPFSLRDAFESQEELRRYTELSLISPLLDRYFLTRNDLKRALGSVPGQARRIQNSLRDFKNHIDFAGEDTLEPDFWFSTLL